MNCWFVFFLFKLSFTVSSTRICSSGTYVYKNTPFLAFFVSKKDKAIEICGLKVHIYIWTVLWDQHIYCVALRLLTICISCPPKTVWQYLVSFLNRHIESHVYATICQTIIDWDLRINKYFCQIPKIFAKSLSVLTSILRR